ncbi:unnamed protein product [Clonostachys chloroleuca]|uniref:Uncharacterized protein n=1 Tax=Clonostachys chloroleuca TaxID=1926264 RepID=A0AA35M4D8_9HYPO|nr:unnamed protein product [Clonostachys chloroleuca]
MYLLLLIRSHLLLEGGVVLGLLHLALGGGVVADGEELLHEAAGLLLLAVVGDDGALVHVGGLLLPLGLDDLGLEGQLGGEGAGHAEGVEVAVLALDLAVLAVLELRGLDPLVAADLAREAHGLPAEEVVDGIVEAVGADGVPGAEEDDVAEEDLVLEGGAEVAVGFGEGALDLAADAGHGLDGGALELGDLEGRGEHVLDEGGVLEDLIGVAGELELLHDLGGLVDAEDGARGGDAEAGGGGGEGVEADEARVGGDEGRVDGAEAVHVLGGVLEHAAAGARVRQAVDGHGLEAAPAQGEDEGVVGLEDPLVPAVALDADLDEAEAVLGGGQPPDDDGGPRAEPGDELGGDVLEDDLGVLACAVALDGLALALVQIVELLLVDIELLLDDGLLGVVPFVLAKLLDVAAVASGVGLVVEESVSVFFLEALLQFLLPCRVLLALGFDLFCGLLLGLCWLLGLEVFKDTIALVILAVVPKPIHVIIVTVIIAAFVASAEAAGCEPAL